MELNIWLNKRLKKTKSANLYRKVRTMGTAPISEVVVDGKKKLVFSSNNYLGLANDERLIRSAKTALFEFGLGSSGSRLTTGNSLWHERLEQKIACFKQTEAALVFSSGYLANVGTLSSIPEQGDVILSDQYNHASIIDGCRLSKAKTVIYRHIDMKDLEQKLKETKSFRRRFIVTDGVFSMDGTIAPLDTITSLARKYNAYVIVDDAHATGVLGKSGKGTSEYFNVQPDITVGTLSKAVGVEGGFVAGSKTLIDFLTNNARTFIFQTALSPAICAAAYVAFEIIEESNEKQQRLFSNVQRVKNNLQEMGFVVKGGYTPIIPVIIRDAKKAILFAEMLEKSGIYTPAIRPPTVPNGESRIRITITSDHTTKEIDHLLHCFQDTGQKLNVI